VICASVGVKVTSNTLRDNGATRRFSAPHLQMMALRRRAPHPRLVFYVLPDLGTTLELTQGLDLLSRTWLLDVATLPQLPPPTKEDGSLRRSGEHYIDLAPPWVTVHSDPVKVGAMQLDELARQLAVDANDLPRVSRLSSEWLNADDWPFSRKSLALAIGPPADAQGEKAR
jgi:hypothetical protein